MRIALAQINPTVGDIAGNTAKIMDFIRRAADQHAELAVFPELSIIGYPPKDLLLKPAVIEQCDQALRFIARHCTRIAAIIGYPAPSDQARGRTLYNAAAVCIDGRVAHRHVKSLLPTYDVFDEHRYFEPGPPVDLTEFRGVKLGISVCEDLWNDQTVVSRQLYHDNPMDELAKRGAELFINCSASPFVVRKHEFRLKLFHAAAKRHALPLVYVNQVGGNDELIFDGRSCVVDATGQLIAQAKGFEEDLLVVDLPTSGSGGGQTRDAIAGFAKTSGGGGMAELFDALVLGVRDYCIKCGFKSIVLGLSGGIDSAVTACIAAAALGADHVTGIAMPSRYSSDGSKSDAMKLAENLGIAFHTIPISSVHDPMERLVSPFFEGKGPDATEENLQARLRGVILMSFSNKFGSLLVTTGNKSEMAVGYCTLYGDMAGGLAVISDVPKTMIYELAKWINSPTPAPTPGNVLYARCGKPVIPADTISKPPSAELRPNQTDQDSLPPYELLDDVVHRYVEREESAPRIIGETGYDAATVQRIVGLIDRNEYKRKQAPPGLKVTGKAFGFGRRMPIAMRHDATGKAMERIIAGK
ncbi:MAG: NAD+ synthase [Phycisphaeraceae bacterium]